MTLPGVRGADTWLDEDFQDEFCSGMFSDELDLLKRRTQVAPGFLINNPKLRCIGRARTVRLETIETQNERIEVGLGFLETLEPGEILVVEGSPQFAYFGELMSRLSLRANVAGIVIDGLTRDSFYTQGIALPIFCKGYSPVDIKGRGRVADLDVEVSVSGVACRKGDLIFADADAVVVIPADMINSILKSVNKMASHEQSLKASINEGATVSEILQLTKAF